jgi:UDP-N-acetylmuramoyl-L-alanyl-D-glutamate--2,6-diaminopimelate ligase
MGAAAQAGADRVVVTSDNPRLEPPQAIIDEILRVRRGAAVLVEPDRAAPSPPRWRGPTRATWC